MKNPLIILIFIFLFAAFPAISQSVDSMTTKEKDTLLIYPDTIRAEDLVKQVDDDAAMEEMLMQLLRKQSEELAHRQDSVNAERMRTDVTTLQPFHIGFADSLRMQKNIRQMKGVNPLAMDLVFTPISLNMNWNLTPDFGKLYFGETVMKPKNPPLVQLSFVSDTIIVDLRESARQRISTQDAGLYVTTFDKLPETKAFASTNYLPAISVKEVVLTEKSLFKEHTEEQRQKLRNMKAEYSKWIKNASALLQFSQNYISSNWYKGGNSNIAILGILSGNINYDDKKNIAWENSGEWRAGFNSVSGDTIRKLSTNEDLFRLYSKLGIKAFKNFYYSASAEFQTQFFDTYTGINSTTLKTAFCTPIRFNLALGLDYKPNKDLSVVLAPLSYKFVYVRDTARINQTNFSVEENKKYLSEWGSSVRVEWTYKPVREVSIVSKLYCYTNYKKVELDFEVICDFIINRYMTTRIMLHPRYDSTVIMENDEKAKMQFKELISVGFAHKF